ncbi:hypothetical protein DL98DRAFT_637072 [Cadophora sp. DSE1049]|nr:hypothetical protein DL98DRAFT_637072 [Cadophora sp. DSE1049]
MEANHGPKAQGSLWNPGREILYKHKCAEAPYRSFLTLIDGREALICYAEDANLHRDSPIHTSQEHGSWPHARKTKVNMNMDSRILPRFWSVLDTNGNAAHGVVVGTTLARRPIPEPFFKPHPMEQALTYEQCFGTADITMYALSWLKEYKHESDDLCKNHITARSTLTKLEFVLFPFLPSELRLKIISRNHSSANPRYARVGGAPPILHGRPLSRQCPPLLHTCRESRYEASNCYEDINLEFRHLGDIEKKVKFNPSADILLFGTGCCIQSLAQFCRIAYFRNKSFSRVAVSSSYQFRKECEIVLDIPPNFVDPDCFSPLAIDVIRGINTEGNQFPAMGSHLPSNRNDPYSIHFYPGLPGIEEILLVVDTHLDGVKPTDVDYSTTSRPVDDSSPGINELDTQEMVIIQSTMEHYGKRHADWQLPAANPWVGASVPKYSFVNLTDTKPSESGNTTRFSMIRTRNDLERSGLLHQDVKRTIEAITGCIVTFPLQLILPETAVELRTSIKEELAEIGISGPTQTAVHQAVIVLNALLTQQSPWYSHFRQYIRQTSKHLPVVNAENMLWDAAIAHSYDRMDSVAHEKPTSSSQDLDAFSTTQQPWLYNFANEDDQDATGGQTFVYEPNPMHNLIAMLDTIDSTTVPSRQNLRDDLEFDDDHDAIEKHRWWLSDHYYKASIVDWKNDRRA